MAFGGAVYNGGTLIISGSTLSHNQALATCSTHRCHAGPGGIFNRGNVIVRNSTISGNYPGAINNFGSRSTVAIINSTVSGNSGGAIFSSGAATLQNSIVANNSGGNCFGVTSKGYNLSSDGSCAFNGPGDLNNTDPMLGPLRNNGGPTKTMALLPGSPAIDAANPLGCTDGNGHLLKTDQRGMPRHDPEDIRGCDMGAYEHQGD